MGPLDRLWVAATLPELACAPGAGGAEVTPEVSPWTWSRRGEVAFLATGAGPVSAAAALAWFLALHPVRSVVGIGIAGLLPGSSCAREGVFRVVRDGFPEHGAESRDEAILPLDFPGLRERSFQLDTPPDLVHLPPACALTVGLATGSARTALRRRAGGADLESMEGASWAFAALRFGTTFAQVRSVSNLAGFRDRADWDVPGALQRLRLALAGSPEDRA